MQSNKLNEVRKNIERACQKVGRKPQEVTLIAVSKTKPIPMLLEVYDEGMLDFGENKVQELTDKYEKLSKDIRWHMIGHLQTNKVKYIIDKAHLIHSVDSLRLAKEIDKQAEKKNLIANVLIEVNIAEEESKFGIRKEDTLQLIEEVAKLKYLKVKGLMTIAPFTENPEDNRKFFKKIKELSVDISKKKINNIDMGVLSMGMSGDYTVAIEEGATMVRVGTKIFGERQYDGI